MGKIIAGIVVVAALLVSGYFLTKDDASEQAQVSPTPTGTTSTPTPTATVSPSSEVIIRYTSTGFSPSTVTVAPGTKVTFLNESSGLMWPASANHPTHQLLPAFDAKTGMAIGSRFSFTFTNAGTWPFHDHLKPQFFGSVVVK